MTQCSRHLAAAGAVLAAMALASCSVLGPPVSGAPGESSSAPSARQGTIEQTPASGPQAAVPLQSAPAAPGLGLPPAAPQFQLGPAAAALVSTARVQERGGNFALAAETLERALAIEPRNPLVWLELARESLAAGNPAQADGMARKALYLATGDSAVQASAWGLIAAALRAQGQNQAAVAAEQRAARLSVK